MNKLIDIWFRLLITSLDILHYTIRLQYQRLKFTIEDTVRYYRNSEKEWKSDKSYTTNTNEPLRDVCWDSSDIPDKYSSFIFSGNESPKLEKASKDNGYKPLRDKSHTTNTNTVKSEDDGYRNTKPYCETP